MQLDGWTLCGGVTPFRLCLRQGGEGKGPGS